MTPKPWPFVSCPADVPTTLKAGGLYVAGALLVLSGAAGLGNVLLIAMAVAIVLLAVATVLLGLHYAVEYRERFRTELLRAELTVLDDDDLRALAAKHFLDYTRRDREEQIKREFDAFLADQCWTAYLRLHWQEGGHLIWAAATQDRTLVRLAVQAGLAISWQEWEARKLSAALNRAKVQAEMKVAEDAAKLRVAQAFGNNHQQGTGEPWERVL